jgi:hypothetical protein
MWTERCIRLSPCIYGCQGVRKQAPRSRGTAARGDPPCKPSMRSPPQRSAVRDARWHEHGQQPWPMQTLRLWLPLSQPLRPLPRSIRMPEAYAGTVPDSEGGSIACFPPLAPDEEGTILRSQRHRVSQDDRERMAASSQRCGSCYLTFVMCTLDFVLYSQARELHDRAQLGAALCLCHPLLALQRHFSVLIKFTHVESRFCARKRREKVAFDAPVNPCVRSVCSRSVAVGLNGLKKALSVSTSARYSAWKINTLCVVWQHPFRTLS